MKNTKIINRLIDYYLEGSELTQDEHNTVRSLKEEMQAINYTRCCCKLKDLKDDNFDGYTIVDIKGGQIVIHKGEIYTMEFINKFNKMK